MIEWIPLVQARDMPEEVVDWCVYHDITTHYDNSVAYIENGDNPFWQWLLDLGIANNIADGKWVAILAT